MTFGHYFQEKKPKYNFKMSEHKLVPSKVTKSTLSEYELNWKSYAWVCVPMSWSFFVFLYLAHSLQCDAAEELHCLEFTDTIVSIYQIFDCYQVIYQHNKFSWNTWAFLWDSVNVNFHPAKWLPYSYVFVIPVKTLLCTSTKIISYVFVVPVKTPSKPQCRSFPRPTLYVRAWNRKFWRMAILEKIWKMISAACNFWNEGKGRERNLASGS